MSTLHYKTSPTPTGDGKNDVLKAYPFSHCIINYGL